MKSCLTRVRSNFLKSVRIFRKMAGGQNIQLVWRKRIFTILSFFGMALMYSLRFNLSIGIVAMVDHHSVAKLKSQHRDTSTSALPNSTFSEEAAICPALINITSGSGGGAVNGSLAEIHSQGENDKFTKFDWNEKEQGLVLGFFFWGYMITQFPGGLLAQRYGGKWLIGLGLLGTGILAVALPLCTIVGGINCLTLIRFLQGTCEGVMVPAFAVMLSKWTKADERGGMATLCFSGMPFGTAMTMLVSSHLIYLFGWPAVFYVPGFLTVIWFILWSVLVTSSPEPTGDGPRTKQDQVCDKPEGVLDIPWRKIFTSVPVWAIFCSHFANTWGHNTLKAEGPKYLHSVLHFDIHDNALIAATPYLCQWAFCIVVTRLSDYCISKEWISISTSRKLCNTIGQMGTSLAYICLIFADCDRSLAIVAFVMAGLFNGAIYGGILINPVDVAPNYAGVIEGLINGVANLAGFGAPFVAGLILHNESSIFGWKLVFLIPAIGDFVGNLIFVIFSSTTVQPWDNRVEKKYREI